MGHAHIAPGECLNCGAPLSGPYCAQCGQKAGPVNPSFHDLLHDLVHELLHVDGKLFRSVGLLIGRPGFLTREHFAGRRSRYLAPLRLYLIFSILYFGVAAAFPNANTRGFNIELTPSRNETQADVDTRLQELGLSSNEELRGRTRAEIGTWLPRAMFVLVPFFALLVAAVSRRSGYNYPQHLYFALHVHAAVMAMATVGQLAGLIPVNPVRAAIQLAAYGYNLVYVVIALRATYRFTVLGALWRLAIIGPVYLAAIVVAAFGIVVAVMPQLFVVGPR